MNATPDVLFVTLDSCRYDVFAAATAPNLKRVGPLVRAFSPSHFTFGAHAAFFMGFTPGDPGRRERFANSKFGKIFRMAGGGHPGPAAPWIELDGRNIVDGFRRRGHRAIGTGAVGWFDPATETGRALTADFERFHYTGGGPGFRTQRDFLLREIEEARAAKMAVFAFANLGETHVPYWHDGAAWDAARNPCVAFGTDNDAVESRRRQLACVEWVDREIEPLLAAFASGAIVVCSDHGDCWGEDGLWEHGIHHSRTLEVPLLYRLP